MIYYSTDSDCRKPVYYYIAAIAIALTQFVHLIPASSQLAIMAPSALVIFGILLRFYERVAWRWSISQKICQIPDLDGSWRGQLHRHPIDEGGVESISEIEISITQQWRRIAVTFRGQRSSSDATIVGMKCDDLNHVTIKWVYFSKDESGDPTEHLYGEGTTHLTLHKDGDKARLVGYYYSSKLRKGKIEVTKTEPETT